MSKAEVKIDAFENRKKNGRYCCPFCDPSCESRGSLAFYEFTGDDMQKVVYGKCFKCDEKGHVGKFLKELGIAEEHYKDVVIKNVSSSSGKIDKDEINLVYASSFPVIESDEYTRKLINWRGWSYDTIKKFEIRFLPVKEIFNFPDKYRSWLPGGYVNERGAKIYSQGWYLFPFFNKAHKVIYIKGRNFVTDAANKDYKRFKNTKGTMPFPYGLWLLKDYLEQESKTDDIAKREAKINELFENLHAAIPPADLQEYITFKRTLDEQKQKFLSKLHEPKPSFREIFICEGETDTLSAHSAGIFAVGIPGAHAFRQSWCKYFQNLNVCIAFDSDDAGQDAMQNFREMLQPFAQKVRKFKLPDGFNDYSEMFQSRAHNRRENNFPTHELTFNQMKELS